MTTVSSTPFNLEVDEHVSLRIRTLEETQVIYDLVINNRAHLAPWFPWVAETKTVDDSRTFIQKNLTGFNEGKNCDFGIYYEGQMIGSAGFHTIDTTNKSGAIGYWITKEFEGRGIITAVVKKLIELGKDKYQLHRIEILLDIENSRSRAVPKRLGFIHEATISDMKFYNGAFHTMEMWNLLV